MSQRIVTLCKIANPDNNIEWVNSSLSGINAPIIDHYKTPFVLYWAQWHDPWLSIGEYNTYAPRYLGITPVFLSDDIISIECSFALKEMLKKSPAEKASVQ